MTILVIYSHLVDWLSSLNIFTRVCIYFVFTYNSPTRLSCTYFENKGPIWHNNIPMLHVTSGSWSDALLVLIWIFYVSEYLWPSHAWQAVNVPHRVDAFSSNSHDWHFFLFYLHHWIHVGILDEILIRKYFVYMYSACITNFNQYFSIGWITVLRSNAIQLLN